MGIAAVDLFCGVGGLTYGLQNAGISVVAGVDIDVTCKYPFERNNKARFVNASINDFTGDDVRRLLRGHKVKILVGCAPCQPFSNHQRNKGDRSSHRSWSLLYQFARIVSESRPHIVSMENVPELVKERVFVDFVESLQSCGYSVTKSIINVADYGIAQSRRRLILFASKVGAIRLLPPSGIDRPVCVRDVIGGLPAVAAGEVCKKDRLHQSSRLSDLNVRRIRASVPNGTWRDWGEDLTLACHKRRTGRSYGSVYGRMSWDGVAPTITTQFTGYGTGRFGHPDQDRALTLREGALLQSFPADYVFVADGEPVYLKHVARHIGNAVPPRLGEIIGQSIISSLPPRYRGEISGV